MLKETPVIVALRWYGPEPFDIEIVGPFNSGLAASKWGDPRGFRRYQVVWTPRERENYDAMMPGVGADDD